MSQPGQGCVRRAVVLAAGEGKRLRPLTTRRPKPMLQVAGRPLLEHSIRWLRHHGIDQVTINLWHEPAAVISYLGDGSMLGVSIGYSVEESLLGTAGGVVRMVEGYNEPFVVLYGDVLTDLDLQALIACHLSRPAEPHVTLCLYRVPNPTECGIVETDMSGRVTRFLEKPSPQEIFSDLASAGVMVFDPPTLSVAPERRPLDFGRDLFPMLVRKGTPMYGWPLPDRAYLIDIGTPEKYARVQSEWPTREARKFLI